MASKNNTDWTGWVVFASVLMIVAGFFHVIAGLVGLFKNDIYVVAPQSTWLLSYTAWGWAHMIWGLLAIWAGSSLMKGNMFGRIVAVMVAVSSALVSLAFVPVYPIWSILIIVLDICIIYAVTVHGKEMQELQ